MARRLPSVTELLACFGFYDGLPALDAQRQQDVFDRGTLVHRACHWLGQGRTPQWKQPHDELSGYLSAYKLFQQEHTWQMTACEQEFIATSFGYVTHLDQVGLLDDKPCLLELKTGMYNPAATQLQTAGQALAAQCGGGGTLVRYCLLLDRDGGYRLILHNDSRDTNDWIVLTQCAHLALKYGLPLGRKLKQIMEERTRD